MNIVLQNRLTKQLFMSTASRDFDSLDTWTVNGTYLHSDGTLFCAGGAFSFRTQKEAEKRCRGLAKKKCQRKGFCEMDLADLPVKAQSYLSVDPDKWVSPGDMIRMIRAARYERYVYFSDVNGIDEWFDCGVQYLGILSSDEELVDVYDKFGTLRAVMVTRLERMEQTEMHDQMEEAKLKEPENED